MNNQFTIELNKPAKRDDYNEINLDNLKVNSIEDLYNKFEEMFMEESSDFTGNVSRINSALGLHSPTGKVYTEIKLLDETFTSVEITLKGDRHFASTLSELEEEQFMHTLEMMLEDYSKAFYNKAIELGFIKE